MLTIRSFVLPLLVLACSIAAVSAAQPPEQNAPVRMPISRKSLAEARQGFTTHLIVHRATFHEVPKPPAGIELVHYDAPLGSFPAFVATVPVGKNAAPSPERRPAIVWLVGGFDNDIIDTPWRKASPDNDQSARAFREAGIVTMYPSLRGGNDNAGYLEGMYGEVDDVIAAARYLASRPDVDPSRIYLGGHSTGGTLALLVAESTDAFRAVFSFGPTAFDDYTRARAPYDTTNLKERALRAPVLYLSSIKRPTFIFEGTVEPSNNQQLHMLAKYDKNPLVACYDLPGKTHFTELAAITPIVAQAIAADSGAQAHLGFSDHPDEIAPILAP